MSNNYLNNNLRIAEVKELDLQLDDGGSVVAYRAKVRISFRYHGEEDDD
jgi:flavin-binding protein dodecin